MKAEITSSTGASRLIIIFAGWAMDARPFRSLKRRGYDIAVVWDYTSPEIDWSFAESYGEVCIVAWSLGVAVADVATGITAPLEDRITLRLAVNGTTTPIDDTRGIPGAVFRGTAANLCGRSLQKFYLRTAGARRQEFMAVAPERTVESAAAELDVFLRGELYPANPRPRGWSRAVVSSGDAVFPPENMIRAWESVPVDVADAPHWPDFQTILNHYIIDKENTAGRFAAGASSYDSNATVQRSIAQSLLSKAREALGADAPARILEVGCGTGILTRLVAESFGGAELEMWDLCPAPWLGELGLVRSGDAEVMVRRTEAAAYGMVISASTIQWFNSPGHFLGRCSRALTPGGILAVSTFGPDNLCELSRHTGLGLPTMALEQWKKLKIDGLTLVGADQEHIQLRFDGPMDIFRHLKKTGVNSLGSNSTAMLRKALNQMSPAGDDGGFELTYHPIYLIYKAK